MTTLIKIKRDSIKKNPNAGNTVTRVQGLKSVSFIIESYDIPDLPAEFIVTDWVKNGKLIKASGVINGPITSEQFAKWVNIEGIRLTVENGINTIHHMPEPDYLYEYEETYLKCKHCKNKINVEDIETDYDIVTLTCPECGAYDSFPKYKYEKIEDVIKSMQL
jgi:hypothetical protein